jgi:hypothetical protein
MMKKLNAKIDKYNLLVPLLQKQKLHILLKRESEDILKNGQTRYDVESHTQVSRIQHSEDKQLDFLGFFSSWYRW